VGWKILDSLTRHVTVDERNQQAALPAVFLVVLLLAVHHGLDKVLVVNVAFAVLVACEKLLRFLVGEFLTDGGEQVTQLGDGDETIAVLVEVTKTFNEIVACISRASATNCLHDGQKHLERDAVVGPVLVHELLHLGLGWVLAQRTHHIADLRDWDLSIAPLVIQQKRLLKLGDLVLVELNAAGHFVAY